MLFHATRYRLKAMNALSVEKVFETEALEPQQECLQLLGQLVNVRLQRLQHCLIPALCSLFAHTDSPTQIRE